MEKTSAVVSCLGIICATVLLSAAITFGHEDNNRQKQVTIACIESGGEPQFEDEELIGCSK